MRFRRYRLACRARVALTIMLLTIGSAAGCSSHGCKLGGFPPDITEVFFDLRPIGLAADPELTFTMCSNGRCESVVRPSDPALISGAGARAGEQLEHVSLTIADAGGTERYRSRPAPGPFPVDDLRPNGEGCPPRQFQRWFAVTPDGQLVPEAPQPRPLR